jgi:hypothetical protein
MGANPMTWITALSAGAGVFDRMRQSENQAAWSEYSAGLAEAEAKAKEYEAEEEAGELRKKSAKELARQRALFSKRGVRLEGSPLLVLKETAGEAEQDIQERKREAALESALKRSKAGMLRLKAGEERKTGILKTGRTLLTGIERTMNSYGRQGRRIFIGRR